MKNGKTSLLCLVTLLSFIVINSLASVASAADLCPGQGYDVGRYPYSMAVGDFNGDGKLDLVTANNGFDNVSVLLGDGAGRFGAAKAYGVGSKPKGIAVADFNGDGISDIVTANNGSGDVSVLIGDGSGGFGGTTNYQVGGAPGSVAVGDFNSDGKLDLAVDSFSIKILTGDGTGHFSNSTGISDIGASFVVAGDINRDGKVDLVVAHGSYGYVSVFLGNGSGEFTATPNLPTGMDPDYVAVGDLNGDSIPDLVVTNNTHSFPPQVVILLGNGTGGFASPVYYGVGNQPTSISIGDFNGDGKADLATANFANSVSLLLGDGTGSFGSATSYSIVGEFVTAGDFNADGKTDLAVSSEDFGSKGKVSIFFNSCNAVPTPSPTPTTATYSISGKIVNATFFTQVKLSGTQGGLSGVDDSGNYSFKGLPAGGTYTVTPYSGNAISQYTFSPSSKTVTNLSADQTFDFTQTPKTNSISGRIANASGVGIAGVQVALDLGVTGRTTTDSNGNYSFPNLSSGQFYHVSPGATARYTFTPSSVSVMNLNGDVTANFTAIPLYNITGRITDSSGAAIEGALVMATGPTSRSTTTDSNGNYLLNSLMAGDYQISISKLNYGFNPATSAISNLSQDQTLNITGFRLYNIGGIISDESGSPVSGVTVTLSGSPTQTLVTTTIGTYQFNNLPAGGDYTVTPSKDGYTFSPASRTVSNLSSNQAFMFTTSRLTAETLRVGEAGGTAAIVINRSGDLSGAASIDYATSDTAGLESCSQVHGVASSRCDYATTVGTLRFASGESSKPIFIPIVDDGYIEGPESFTLNLSHPVGMSLGPVSTVTVTITDNDSRTTNPIVGVPFFVRQQYIDFLGREPDPTGFAAWQSILNSCAAGDTGCDRIAVSSGFFRSPEFQDRGYFIYRFYSAALGRKPLYSEFMPDLAKVSGFLTTAQLEANKVAFVNEFMARTEYVNRYASLSNAAFVDALIQTAGLTGHPLRDTWIGLLDSNGATRAEVLRAFTESLEVYQKFYNEAFVVMQYFGYLRRDPDASYLQWIQTMTTNGGDYRAMISGFINSNEYVLRFGP